MILLPSDRAEEVSAQIAAFFVALGCPLSWHKFQLSTKPVYLGFTVDTERAELGIPEDKVVRICNFLRQLQPGDKVHRKVLERGIGLLQWATWIAPPLRPWLSTFYWQKDACLLLFCCKLGG